MKPEASVEYNAGKAAIDLSDQLDSYATTLRKSVKWYQKLGFDLLLGLSCVNVHIMSQKIKQQKIPIKTF